MAVDPVVVLWSRWRGCLRIVQPATVIAWHRRVFAWFLDKQVAASTGKTRRDSGTQDLIRHMIIKGRNEPTLPEGNYISHTSLAMNQSATRFTFLFVLSDLQRTSTASSTDEICKTQVSPVRSYISRVKLDGFTAIPS